MRSSPGNGVKTRNEVLNFFEGPIYLLPLKVPVLLVGIILYMIYAIVKFTIGQLVKLFSLTILCIAHFLVEDVGYYLMYIYRNFPTYAQYFMAKVFSNVLQPVKFFILNCVLPAIHNVSEWIWNRILWSAIWYYQQIILPIVRFCYLRIIAPIPTWITELSIAFRKIFRWLFRRFLSACTWAWQHILYPLCLFIFIDVPLSFYRNFSKITSFIYTRFFTPLNRCIRYMAPIISDYLRMCVLHVGTCLMCTVGSFSDACMFLYEYTLLALYQNFFKISSTIFNSFITPINRCLRYIAPIIYGYLRMGALHVGTCLVCTIGSFSDACMFFYGHTLLALYHNFFLIKSLIYTRFFAPLNRCIRYVAPIIYGYLRAFALYTSICLICTIGSFYDACAFLHGYTLLALYRNFFMIKSLIYTRFFAPLNRCIRYIAPIIYGSLRICVLHVGTCLVCAVGSFYDACTFLHAYTLLALYHNFFMITSLIYTRFFAPLNRCIRYVAPIIYGYLRTLALYTSTCLVLIIGSFYDSCAFLYRHSLLAFYHNFAKIGLLVYTRFFIPLNEYIRHIAPIVYHYLRFYGCQLLQSCKQILMICPSIYHSLLKSAGRLVLITRLVYDKLYQFIVQFVGSGLYSMGQFSYEYLLAILNSTVYPLLSAIAKVSIEIIIVVRSALNSAALAISKIGRTVDSRFRTNTDN